MFELFGEKNDNDLSELLIALRRDTGMGGRLLELRRNYIIRVMMTTLAIVLRVFCAAIALCGSTGESKKGHKSAACICDGRSEALYCTSTVFTGVPKIYFLSFAAEQEHTRDTYGTTATEKALFCVHL